jgi:valyl-tRNA synthetase
MERSGVEPWLPESLEDFQPEPDTESLEVPVEDRWIFSRLNSCAAEAARAIEQYRYQEFAQVLWQCFWHEFCDWYIELKKIRFRENSGLNADWRNTLAAFETALRLLHPAMPFLTEELWQRLAQGRKDRPASIALAGYPRYQSESTDHKAEREIEIVQQVVTMARNLRAENKLDPKLQLDGALYSRNSALEIAEKHAPAIQELARVKLHFHADAAPKAAAIRSTPEFDLVLQLPKAQEDAQRKRLEKECEQLAKNIANSKRQLSDDVFLSKAPPQVIESIRKKLADYESQWNKTCGAL